MAPRPTGSPVEAGGFEHLGYLYRHPSDYLATAAGFVHSTLAAGNPVLLDFVKCHSGHRASRLHPALVDEAGNRWASAHYDDPLRSAAMFNEPMPAPPASAERMSYQHAWDLTDVRDFVHSRAIAAGMDAERLGHVVVAVNELATNTIDHTSGPGTVRVWADRSAFVCQVEDTGHLTDPLAGRVPPAPHQLGGRGLVLVNELCDLVLIHSRPGLTTVRTYHYL